MQISLGQVAVAFARTHSAPQAPQFASESRGASQPLLRLPSQLPQGKEQVGAHAPAEHAWVPCGFVHVIPQAPQLAVSPCRFAHALLQHAFERHCALCTHAWPTLSWQRCAPRLQLTPAGQSALAVHAPAAAHTFAGGAAPASAPRSTPTSPASHVPAPAPRHFSGAASGGL